MKPTSKLFTISEAAKELDYSSRSTIYRLIEKGCFLIIYGMKERRNI